MKHVKRQVLALVTMSLFLISNKSIAQYNIYHKNYVEGGLAFGNQNASSLLSGVYGSFGFFFTAFNRPASVDFRARELYILNPEQQGTFISATFRYTLVNGLFVGIGGAHGHQVMMNEFKDHAISAVNGTNPHIIHTSGFNTEVGYNFNSLVKDKKLGLYPVITIAYTQLFAPSKLISNVTLNAGLRIGFKKWS